MTSIAKESPMRLAMITGGTSGVGLECAKLLLEQGASVFICGHNADKLNRVISELDNPNVRGVAGDVRQSQTAIDACAQARAAFGQPVDLLINSAGTILRESASSTSDEDWQFVMDVNVNGVFFFSRSFSQQATRGGAIVNVSSTCGQVGAAGLAAYCASKGAVDQLTRSMALELAARKITVNAVAPGAINSPMLYSKHAEQVEAQDVKEANLANIPIGSLAEPKEVARSILFLASEPHITGTILSVDGGYTAA